MKHSRKGFTLVELLIALFIFAIMMVMVATFFHDASRDHTLTKARAIQLTHLQLTFKQIQNDVQGFLDKGNLKGDKTNLMGSRIANKNEIQHIQYSMLNGNLVRIVDGQPAGTSKLIHHLDQLRFRYLNEKNQWHTKWQSKHNSSHPLPRAVEVFLTFKNKSEMHWIFALGTPNES